MRVDWLIVLLAATLIVAAWSLAGCTQVRVVGTVCDITVDLAGVITITDCSVPPPPCDCGTKPGASALAYVARGN